MKILATLFFLCIFVSDFYAQKWGANTFSQFTNEALDVEIDASGNSYITGYVTGETAFNTSNVIQNAAGNGDIYVAKYNSSGALVWYKKFGGNYSDRAYDLAIGPDQNIVVTGQFFGSVTFGSTTLQSASNSKDIFLFKLDPNGNVIWALKEGGDLAENAYGVTVDHQNNVILTGQFKGNSTIANSNFTSAIDPVTSAFSFDLFISKYDPTGNPLWVKAGYAIKDDRGLAVAVDNQDNIFLSGQYSDTLTFAGNTYNNNGYNVGFLTKITPSGQVQFFNNLRAGIVLPYDLEVNSSNDVVVIGDFLGDLFYYNNNLPSASIQNPYTNQIFVLKIGNNGNLLWNYTLGSESDISAASVSIDPSNNVFVTGYFNCALSQLHDVDPELWNSVGFQDPYILNLSNQGNFIYAKQMGGKMDDVGHGIAIQSTDKPIVCGGFTKSMNVAPTNPNGVNAGNNNYQLNNSSGEVGQFFLMGDSTRNSFLLKYVDANYPNYNYYNVPASDSLVGYIVPSQNTVHYCQIQNLNYETFTWDLYGPSYQYVWSNGSTTDSITAVSISGPISVVVTRNDGCATDSDNSNLIVDPIPALPLLSDNLIQFTNQVADGNGHYGDYFLCLPQDIPIYYTNLAAGTSLTTIEPNGNVIIGSGVVNHNQVGEYAVIVDNGFCTDTAYYTIDFQFSDVYNVLDLGLNCNKVIVNDTIKMCEIEEIYFWAFDSITNPLGNYQIIGEPYVASSFTVNGQVYLADSINDVVFMPQVSGNYHIEFDLIIGYINICGVDTTRYHIERDYYIQIFPTPWIDNPIIGDNFLCPNGSVFLTTALYYPNLQWTGAGISWESTDNDSIEINLPGYYSYTAIVVDSINNICNYSVLENFEITLKQAPNIDSSPLDAVICPNDSAILSVPNNYQTYVWVGPDGDSLSNSNTCFGLDQGFYYCHVVDDEGCVLTTPAIELIEYSTPSVTSFPQNYICDDEIITIMVNYVGSPTFQWSPIATNADEILVNQPGVYSVTIEQCGITLTQDFTIVDASLNPILTNSAPNCLVDEITIQGNVQNAIYYWSTGDTTAISSINVSEFGDYSATVVNEYGCEAQTNTLHLTNFSGSFPPPMDSVTICFGSDVNFLDSSGYILNWYDLDTNFLQTSSTLNLPNVQSDTAFLIAYSFEYCIPVYKFLLIDVVDSVALEILGDSIYCPNETIEYFINTVDNVTWSIPNQILGTSNPISLNPTLLQGSEVIYATITNQCFTQTFIDSIHYLTPDSISFADNSIVICQYETLPISLVENVTSTTWTGSFGTVNSNSLSLNAQLGNGTITASAIDLNGCYTDTISLNLTIADLDYTIVTNFSNLCDGSLATVEVITDADSLLWTTPIGTYDSTFFSFNSSENSVGTYFLTIWDSNVCHYDTSISIVNFPLPIFNLDSDTMLCLNDIYTYVFPSDTNDYTWSFYGSTNEIPVNGNQNLVLTATSPAGCIFTDTIYVSSVNCDDALPNFLTSNGDGVNDYLVIDEAILFPNNHLTLYNRWGEKIFDQESYQNTFEGSRFSEGVYWYVFYQDPINNPKKVKQGFLHIYH